MVSSISIFQFCCVDADEENCLGSQAMNLLAL